MALLKRKACTTSDSPIASNVLAAPGQLKARYGRRAASPSLLRPPGLREQFGDIHDRSRGVPGLKRGCAQFDGTGLPAVMILAQDVCIAGQERSKGNGIYPMLAI